MALRANMQHKKERSFFMRFLKWTAAVLVLIAALAFGFILYFNGQNVRAPLLKFLSSRTSFTLNCEKVEFSALYPNVLKLSNLTFGKSKVGQIYVEYDLPSLLSSRTLELKEFYAKDAQIAKEDLAVLSKEKFSFEDIKVSHMDLINAPLYFELAHTDRGTFSGSDVIIESSGKLTFSQGSISFDEGIIDGSEVRKFAAKVKYESDDIRLEDLSVQMLGGTVLCDARIDRETQAVTFSRLNLANTILLDLKDIKSRYNMYAQEATANNCVLSVPRQDLLLGQINGTIYDLFIGNNQISFDFEGRAGEISKPQLGLSADNSEILASVKPDEISLKLDGNILGGEYTASAIIRYDDQNKQILHIDEASLKGGKIEPTMKFYTAIKDRLYEKNTVIDRLSIEDTEFVSNIDELPVSIQKISLNAKNLRFTSEASDNPHEKTTIKFGFSQGYYLDLYLRELQSTLSYDSYEFTLNVPKLTLQESSLSFGGTLKKDLSSIQAFINAKDFETGELNSSLTDTLFNGRVSFDGQIYTSDVNNEADPASSVGAEDTKHASSENDSGSDIQGSISSLLSKLEGRFGVRADSMLVSAFGLDLINGGRALDYALPFDKFIKAISSGDLAFYKAKLDADIKKGIVYLHSSGDLTSSHLTLNGTLSLSDGLVDTLATLVSLPKDSITRVNAKGENFTPVFYITALCRGDQLRQGINTDVLTDKGDDPAAEDAPNEKALPVLEPSEPSDVPQSTVISTD